MFKTNVYVRGIRQSPTYWYIAHSTLFFRTDKESAIKMLHVHDVVEIDKFFLGVRYSSKSYVIEIPANQLKLS